MTRIFIFFLLLFAFQVSAQTITGSVSDGATGLKIPGASITLTSSGKGTITDSTGGFSLEGKGTIQVSALGYKPVRLIPADHFLSIELIPRTNQLQTVEVTGRVAKDYNSEYSFSATRYAINGSSAFSRFDKAQKKIDSRGFSSSVLAEQRKDFTWLDVQVQIVQGSMVTVLFGEIFGFKHFESL